MEKYLAKKFDNTVYFLVSMVLVFNLTVILAYPLSGEEAYYWLWSKHLSLGYYDHPPLIGWLIRLSTLLLGDTVLGVRLFAAILGWAGSLLFYRSLRNLSDNPAPAFWGGLLYAFSPFLNVYFCLIYPDTPLLFFWNLSLYFFSRSLKSESKLNWVLLGFSLSLTVLSKLNGLLLPGCIVFYLLFNLKNAKKLIFTLPAFILPLIPYLLWNYAHNWQTVYFQFYQRHNTHFTSYKHLLDYLSLQAAGYTPFIFLFLLPGIFWAVYREFKRRDKAYLLGLSFFLPVFLTFLFFSLTEEIQPNWTLIGFPGAFILLGLLFSEISNKLLKGLMGFALGFAILLFAVSHLAFWYPEVIFKYSAAFTKGDFKGNNLTEAYAYPEMGKKLKEWRAQKLISEDSFIFTEAYHLSSALTFYSGEFVHLISKNLHGREYYNWENYPQLKGKDAIYIALKPRFLRPDLEAILQEHFSQTKDLPSQIILWQDKVAHFFYLTDCYNFSPRASGGASPARAKKLVPNQGDLQTLPK